MATTDTAIPTTSQRRAREIMGRNLFGVEEAIRHFGVNPTKQQTAALSETPFTEATLEACKDSHVLVAVFPLSILEIRNRVDRRLLYSREDAWCNQQAFAKQEGEAGWALVRKTPVANSTAKTWQEQQALLREDEETPTARVMVYAIIGHYLATGERLFENIYVRCSDVDSGGFRVLLGRFDADGLFVSDAWDGHRDDDFGASSARKSN
jgi:hypothetical protein